MLLSLAHTREELAAAIAANEPNRAVVMTMGALHEGHLDLLRRAVDELGQSVIMVTHDTATAAYADRVLVCRDGRIVSDLRDITADNLTAALR